MAVLEILTAPDPRLKVAAEKSQETCEIQPKSDGIENAQLIG